MTIRSVLLLSLLSLLAWCVAGAARAEIVGLRIVADCTPAEAAVQDLTASGLLLRDAWIDARGQHRERWVSADGLAWAEVVMAQGPHGEARCVIALPPVPPGEPT